MRSTRLLLLLPAMAIVVLSGALIASQVTATTRATLPDRLEIMRTMGRANAAAHEMVTQSQPVQNLYKAMLALPPAPAAEICPQYIIASYQLTFYAHNAVVQRAKALRGLCQPVTLGNNDVRSANARFWTLMNKAIMVGKPVSMSVGTATHTPVGTPTRTSTGTLTSTPVWTPTVYVKR